MSGKPTTNRLVYWTALIAIAAAGGWFAYDLTSGPRPPTVAEYLDGDGKGGTLVSAGALELDGTRIACEGRPTVMNPKLDDVAAVFPDFIILNPKAMSPLPKPVKLYAYLHECGHLIVGLSEEKADCFAIAQGKSQGALLEGAVAAICEFWKSNKGDSAHLPGPERCKLMQACWVKGMAGFNP